MLGKWVGLISRHIYYTLAQKSSDIEKMNWVNFTTYLLQHEIPMKLGKWID